MKINTISYSKNSGWIDALPADFDSQQTLVIVFGATSFLDNQQPLQELASILSIAISCVGRRLILGERAEEELEAVMDSLPEQTQQIGFYSYGEISPYAAGHCDLHNQTMTLTTIAGT
jgi:hypothetical protein